MRHARAWWQKRPTLLLRSFIYMLWMALTLVPWALFVLVASAFTSRIRLYWLSVPWLRGCIEGARILLGIHTRITGMEHLPPEDSGPVILLVKHQSAYETLLIPTLVSRPLAFVFKKELLLVPFFGWVMSRFDMIHIDRSQGIQSFNKVMAQGRQLLAQGISIILFPEGTRIPRGRTGAYKTSGTRLAVATGVPVIPIAVTSARCWPRKNFIKYPGVVDLSIGKPIPSAGRKYDELMREVEAWIEAEMRRLDPDAY